MKRQIVLAFSLVFLVFGLGSAVIVYNLLRSTSSLQDLIKLHEIEDIRQNLNLRVQKVQAFVHLSALDFSYNLDEIITNIDGIDKAVHGCYNCHHSDPVEKEIHYAEQLLNDYQVKLSYLITAGSDDAWRKDNQQQASKIADTITQNVQDMVNRAAATLQRKTDHVMGQIKRTYQFLAATLIFSLIVMGFIARYLTRRILTQVDKLLLATSKLSAGELGYVTESHGNDEFAQLQKNFNLMSLSLAEKKKENEGLNLDLQNKIDELHNTQSQLVISEKLASLGLLAGGVAHDFNNILCGILGYIALLKQQIESDKSSTATLLTIEKAAHNAAKLVSKLRSFAGQREWQPLPLNVNEIIGAVRQAVLISSPKTVQIDLKLQEALPLVSGDESLLRELLWGICENAVEAIPDPGRIEITTENVITADAPMVTKDTADQPYVRISIRDNGKGIKDQNLDKVFDPYYSTRETFYQRGMGLGMAIAFSIVRQHNGLISVDSKERDGTRVDIYLPVRSLSAVD